MNFEDKRILDFGCGVGSLSFMFDPSYYLGLDHDEKRIEFARRLHPRYKFLVTRDDRLFLQDRSIDYILVIAVLHHIPDNKVLQYLKEFRRVLKPSGKILAIEPCFFKDARLSNCFMGFFDRGSYIRTMKEYFRLFVMEKFMIETYTRFKKLLFYNELFLCAYPSFTTVSTGNGKPRNS